MKTLTTTLFLLLSIGLYAQKTTESIIKFGGQGGVHMNASTVKNQMLLTMGGSGGAIINNQWLIGGFGEGSLNEIHSNNSTLSNYNIEFGHGGPMLGYIIAMNKKHNLALISHFGFGEMLYFPHETPAQKVDYFLLKPGVTYEYKIIPYLKVGIGINYNLFTHFNLAYYSNNDFNKPAISVSIVCGYF